MAQVSDWRAAARTGLRLARRSSTTSRRCYVVNRPSTSYTSTRDRFQHLQRCRTMVYIAVADACNSGADVDTAPATATDSSRRSQTVAMLGRLDQIHRVTRLPTFALKAARNLPIKPVVSFRESARSVEARPLTRRSCISTVRTAAPAGTRDRRQNTRHRDARPMRARRDAGSG